MTIPGWTDAKTPRSLSRFITRIGDGSLAISDSSAKILGPAKFAIARPCNAAVRSRLVLRAIVNL
jgi:hypothetical protein